MLGGSSCEGKTGCPSKSLSHPPDPNLGVCRNNHQLSVEANKLHILVKHCDVGKQTLCSCPCSKRAICVDLQLPVIVFAHAHVQLCRFSCGGHFVGLCYNNVQQLVFTEQHNDLLVWQVTCHSQMAKAAHRDRPDRLRAAFVTSCVPHRGTAPTLCRPRTCHWGRSVPLQCSPTLPAAHRRP